MILFTSPWYENWEVDTLPHLHCIACSVGGRVGRSAQRMGQRLFALLSLLERLIGAISAVHLRWFSGLVTVVNI